MIWALENPYRLTLRANHLFHTSWSNECMLPPQYKMGEKRTTLVAKGTQASGKLWHAGIFLKSNMNRPGLETNAGLTFNSRMSSLPCFCWISKLVKMLNKSTCKAFSIYNFSFVAESFRSLSWEAWEGAQKRKNLDKRKFKLRWLRASDHRAFNNIENVWANSCHGLPEQSDRKGTISGEEDMACILGFYLKLV